ncbi:MAG TPA: SAM-dependent methyltransferase, partial [Casimicrobiaceae bacterium]|nr:SAM-dependent methyltransferase [Casimicrobiaceae bacterium]
PLLDEREALSGVLLRPPLREGAAAMTRKKSRIERSRVTAALAAAAELGTSLTQRRLARSVAFATPRVAEGEPSSEWVRSIAAADAGAIYMGAGQAAEIAAALIAAGKPPATPVAIVESASLAESRRIFTTLASLPRLASQFSGPAVILIGPQFRARVQSVPNNTAEEDSPAVCALPHFP